MSEGCQLEICEHRDMRRCKHWRLWLMSFLVVYVASYATWSRIAFARADHLGASGFYFVTPWNATAWRINRLVVALYSPLILVEHLLGTGRSIGTEPTWENSFSGRVARPQRSDGRGECGAGTDSGTDSDSGDTNRLWSSE